MKEALRDLSLLLISSWKNFDLLTLFPNIWTLPPFQTSIINLYVVTSFCILMLRHDHVLGFISFYISPISLLAITKDSVLLYSMYGRGFGPVVKRTTKWMNEWIHTGTGLVLKLGLTGKGLAWETARPTPSKIRNDFLLGLS